MPTDPSRTPPRWARDLNAAAYVLALLVLFILIPA